MRHSKKGAGNRAHILQRHGIRCTQQRQAFTVTKSPTDYGAIALKVIGNAALEGGKRETLLARRENGTAHICALLLLDPKSTTRHAVNLQGTALDRLKYAKLLGVEAGLSKTRYYAGLRFRVDWHDGGQEPNLAMRYEHGEAHSLAELSPSQEIHYEAWRGACRVLGRRYANHVISCCCFDINPRVSLLPFLLQGLDILAFKVYA
jgi:hypothetical protein